jgi:replication-associated recombination protein RarA
LRNEDRFVHAYIISCPSESERESEADTLARSIVCTGAKPPCGKCENCRKAMEGIHPDIIKVSPAEGKRMITVDQVRTIRSDAYVVPNDAEEKVYIISDAGRMNINAQNAFLKVLEEPPAHVHFIMTADNPGELLPTVRSRCRLINTPTSDKVPNSNDNEDVAHFLEALLSGDRISLIEFTSSAEKMTSQEADAFFRALKEVVASDIRSKNTLPSQMAMKILSESDIALKYLDANVSMGHIMGRLTAVFI